MDCGGGVFDGMVPTSVNVASADLVVDTIKNMFSRDLRGVITVDVLREVAITV
jgi:hypothetical protein